MRTRIIAFLALAAFASGAAALAFEMLWFHQAGLVLGNSVWASSLVLAGFMSGMALGNLLAGRFGAATTTSLARYARLEMVVAAAGVALIHLLPHASETLAPWLIGMAEQPALQRVVRFTAAFALLLVPSTAIGMTLPLLVPTLRSVGTNYGWALGLLYGANTAGAVVGVLVVEIVAIPALGIRGSGWLAALLNALAALLAYAIARPALASHQTSIAAPLGSARSTGSAVLFALEETPPARAQIARWLLAAFVSGFLMLALEVVWLRFETLYLNDTPLAFALILATVLSGIAAGGFVASAWTKRSERALWSAPLVAYGATACGLLAYALYPYVLRLYRSQQDPWMVLLFTAPLVLPMSLGSGILFSLAGVGLSRSGLSDARATAELAFANTLGAGLGSLAGGFVLLPRAGTAASLVGLTAAFALLGLALPVGRSLRPVWRYGGFASCVAALVALPYGKRQEFFVRASASRWMTPHDTVAEVREGLNATLFHIVHRLRGLRRFDQLVTNAYSMTMNGHSGRRYMKLFAMLPEALHPQLRRTLVIGYGIGNTAEALALTPDVERIDIVDISKDVLDISRGFRTSSGKSPLDDPRVRVHIEDGRQFLAGTRERYDLITGEPPPPVLAGVANLYTEEYFELIHARLAEGGFVTYWLPMMNLAAHSAKGIIRAFCNVFEDCTLWHGEGRNFMLVGSRGAPLPAVSADHVSAPFRRDALKSELEAIGIEQPGMLGSLFIGGADYLEQLSRHTPPVTDDWPRRLRQPDADDERDALVSQWRDTRAARQRFSSSPFIARHWPKDLHEQALRHFETRRLLDDLSTPKGGTAARTLEVLHQVLHGTTLRLPVLLLLGSDPDIQAALREAPPAERDKPQWLRHVIAGRLAARDFAAAQTLLERLPDAQLAIPELREYVATVVARQGGSAGKP